MEWVAYSQMYMHALLETCINNQSISSPMIGQSYMAEMLLD